MTFLGRSFRAAIDRYSLLRAIVRSRHVQWLIGTGREARSVRESMRYVVTQAMTKRTGRYRLRESGLIVCVRHRTRDGDILREIFGAGAGGHCYEPPSAVADVLGPRGPASVLDLGGNIGLFGAYALGRWPTAEVTSYEPDPHNARLLVETIALNGLADRWRLVEKAVATRVGSAPFAVGHFADSHMAASGEAAVSVRTADLFGLEHGVDLLKMDIEGGEWPILLEPRLPELRARVILLEWHGELCPEPDAHSTAVRLLRDAGYVSVRDAGRDPEADVGVLWAWRAATR